ncbi:MAG TPA: hypothetical protein VMW41_00850 [Candidatus Bathyarchaeia archaeon]|nr:hypothetical protein [Candidatus Bathyarchaeia archaeon]
MNSTQTIITPIKSSTQKFLEIEDIKDGIIMLMGGSCLLVLTTTAVNFGLLSEQEQDTAIYAYGSLLNSLTFSIQILIRSKRKDISSYLKLLEAQEKKITGALLKEQIQRYRKFIQETVQVNNVLEKKFYIIIPMSFLELGVSKTVGSKIKKTGNLPYPKEYIIEKAKTNLYPKRDHLFRLFNRLGLRSRQLNTQELVRLFFEIYNPGQQGQILSMPADYQTPIVKPATDFMETNLPEEIEIETPTEPATDLPSQPEEAGATEEAANQMQANPSPVNSQNNETITGNEETSPQDEIDQLVKKETPASNPQQTNNEGQPSSQNFKNKFKAIFESKQKNQL